MDKGLLKVICHLNFSLLPCFYSFEKIVVPASMSSECRLSRSITHGGLLFLSYYILWLMLDYLKLPYSRGLFNMGP